MQIKKRIPKVLLVLLNKKFINELGPNYCQYLYQPPKAHLDLLPLAWIWLVVPQLYRLPLLGHQQLIRHEPEA
jgi:hypothetical protein